MPGLGLPEVAEHRQCWEAGGGSVGAVFLGGESQAEAPETDGGEADGSAAGDAEVSAACDSVAEEDACGGSMQFGASAAVPAVREAGAGTRSPQ